MITRRPAAERGHFDHGWLDTWHTFSFGAYHDPAHMGFRSLRVINEDRVQPGQGFGTHAHWDMEILTYVLAGALEHRDSLGNGSVIRPGEVQRISAGTGITHSESNPSADEPVHFLQIWILPDGHTREPSYEQRSFPDADRAGRLHLVASPEGADGAVTIHQDAAMYDCRLEAGQEVTYRLAASRHAWLQLIRGEISVNGVSLAGSDGAAVSNEAALRIGAAGTADFLLLDLS